MLRLALVQAKGKYVMQHKRIMIESGFTLLTGENGQGPLELADRYDGVIDMLVSDVLMAKMDGVVTLTLRLAKRRPDMKFLFISGHPGSQIGALKNVGLTSRFLGKPFLPPQLLTKVQPLEA